MTRPRLNIGLLPACSGDLRVDLGQLLARQRRVVGTGKQILARTIFLDLGFGLSHARAHLLDFTGKPITSLASLVLLHRLLRAEVGRSDRVGDLGCKIRIG